MNSRFNADQGVLIHRTKEGDELLVSQMDDEHLLNTLLLLLKKLQLAKDVLSSKPIDPFMALLEGEEPGMSKDAAEHFVEVFQSKFAYYFLELSIRDFEVERVLACYRELLGRKDKRDRISEVLNSLPSDVGF